MHGQQRTLGRAVECSGIGLHSGKKVLCRITPAPPNHGIRFVRVDLPHRPVITAHFRNVVDTSLATTLGHNGVIVSTIEHLLAALTGLKVDNAIIELNSYEAPIMDGSAWPFTELLMEAGFKSQSSRRYVLIVKKPIEMSESDKKVSLYPDDTTKVTCTIDFQHPMLSSQTFTISLDDGSFERDISRARTFGFLKEVEYLKRNGFAQGGGLDNAVVVDEDRIMNPEGLRYENEFVRHKILDCIGDLSLLGMPIVGHIVALKSGHALNHALLKRFMEDKSCWETAEDTSSAF